MTAHATGSSAPSIAIRQPAHATWVLLALVLSAMTSNINISSANVALTNIGTAFDASQAQLNMIALGAGLGLSLTVTYAGAIADRYGRKLLLVIGLSGIIVTSLASSVAPNAMSLTIARLLTGVASGIAFPATLSLITVLWSRGPAQTRAIAIWSGVSGMASVLGGVFGGILLTMFAWGSVFLMSVPLAIISLIIVLRFVPAHVDESSEPVDHLGGVISIAAISALIFGINFIFVPAYVMIGAIAFAVAIVLFLAFGWRQRRAANPLFELSVASRRLFWAPAVSGAIVFGALVGAVFVGSQFLQNALGYSSLQSGLAGIPAALALLVMSPVASQLITKKGVRTTTLIGFVLVLVSFLTMLMWRDNTAYWLVAASFLIVGAGVALVAAASSKALTSSIPSSRAGMASAASDLQRDLGGAVLQSLLGAVLAAGFSHHVEKLVDNSAHASLITGSIDQALRSSFSSASIIANQYNQYQAEIVQAAKESMVAGSLAAYLVGGIAVLIGICIAWFAIPSQAKEQALLNEYEEADRVSTDA